MTAIQAQIPPVRVGAIGASSLRAACLIGAVLVYALWGTPTPDRPGLPEMATGLLLAAAVGPWGALRAFSFTARPGWRAAGTLLLVFGLTAPVASGLARGNDPAGIVRDLIAFLFLLLPLFASSLFENRDRIKTILTAAVTAQGILFALRVLIPYFQGQVPHIDPFLLGNAPTVLFAALLLTGWCGTRLMRGDTLGAACAFALSLIPLAAMALINQRASIGLYLLTLAALLATGLARKPRRMLLPLAILAIAALAYWPVIAQIAAELWHKNQAVGLNRRAQEAAAVLDLVSASPAAALFGMGWGATVASPAVGGAVVNFTHSLMTTYWLKTGLAGLALAGLYLGRLGLLILRIVPRDPVLALALGAPFAIDILLYASFKSLDFGLLLLLIPLGAELQNPRTCSMQEQCPPDR